jgi:hypothetical protein
MFKTPVLDNFVRTIDTAKYEIRMETMVKRGK